MYSYLPPDGHWDRLQHPGDPKQDQAVVDRNWVDGWIKSGIYSDLQCPLVKSDKTLNFSMERTLNKCLQFVPKIRDKIFRIFY